jgi:small-conductance mechanosensitive channel
MSATQQLAEPLADLSRGLVALLPRLSAAVALALLGWLAGWLLRLLVLRLLRGWGSRLADGIGRLLGSRDVEREVRDAALRRPVAEAVGRVTFWLVFLFFLAAATEALGLPVVSAWLGGVAAYLPRLLLAALVVLLGFLAGGLARAALSAAAASARFAYADALGRMAQGIVVIASAVVAFDQLGIQVTFLTVLAAIVCGTLLGGAALAFGLGARTAVSNIIASHYLLKTYRVGHHVRIGGFEGRIVEITPTAVVIATSEGQALVPAKEFSERASLLLTS